MSETAMRVHQEIERAIDENGIALVEFESRSVGQGLVDLWIEHPGSPTICVSTAEHVESARILVGPYTFDSVQKNGIIEFVISVLLGEFKIRLKRGILGKSIWMSISTREGVWEEGRRMPQVLEPWEEERVQRQ